MQALELYHFYNGRGGGVFSVIKNLLRFSGEGIRQHIIHLVNLDILPGYEITEVAGATSQQVVTYRSADNFHHTCRKIKKLIPNDKVLLVAHDWLELGAYSMEGLQNPLVFYLHGDYPYYYDLAVKHQHSIDLFVTVAANIEKKLAEELPQRLQDISYMRFPVPAVTCRQTKIKGSIIFIGRNERSKGYHLLPEIASLLEQADIKLCWHLVGTTGKNEKWETAEQPVFHGQLSNENLLHLLSSMQVLLLPSTHEGMPISVIEAMKCGVVPVVNDISGGIQELVLNGETGYRVADNSTEEFVKRISSIVSDEGLYERLRDRSMAKANELFDPRKNAALFVMQMLNLAARSRNEKKAYQVYGSRLDKSWVPNWLVRLLRHRGTAIFSMGMAA